MELKESSFGYLKFMELRKEYCALKEKLVGVEYGFLNNEEINEIGIPTLLDVAKAKLNILLFEEKYITLNEASQAYRSVLISELKNFINKEEETVNFTKDFEKDMKKYYENVFCLGGRL